MVGDKMTDLAPFEAQQASPGLHGYLQVEEDKHQESMAIRRRERKSSSTLFDKSNVAISADPIDNVKLIPSKSESHARFVASASAPLSPRSLSALIRRSDKSEEGNGSAGTKKAPTKSSKKWAFRDLLRRTVPNSKADAHYINRTLGDPSSPSAFLSSGRSTSSNMTSHLASPPRTAANHSMDSMASFMDRRGYVRAPRSPRHRSSLTLSPPHPLRSSDTHSDVRKPHIASGTPTPSPPRSPMSPHESYYMHQKAHAQELGKKAFLPYRQSLLGCLRGSDVLSPNQLVW
ncbi:hypothetical protein KP509_19G004900 [Ceratopteris richardii]|nr:hypothetical protein KP509_19G004900 [Ceratopteris richardii]